MFVSVPLYLIHLRLSSVSSLCHGIWSMQLSTEFFKVKNVLRDGIHFLFASCLETVDNLLYCKKLQQPDFTSIAMHPDLSVL